MDHVKLVNKANKKVFWYHIHIRMGEYHKSFLATPNILVYTLIKPKST